MDVIISRSKAVVILTILLGLNGCGGGGGGGSTSTPPVTVASSVPSSSSSSITSSSTASSSSAKPAPLTVFKTSYENAKVIQVANYDFTIPSPSEIPEIKNPSSFFDGSLGFADFFQEGKYSAVVQMDQEMGSDATNNTGLAIAPRKVFFLDKGKDGKWHDRTSELLKDQLGCITPRKVIIADFNGDKRPDVFMACHGYDGTPTPSTPKLGEKQRLLLSQSDGTYKNIELNITAYGHGGSAADINHDGNIDVVLTNTISSKPIGDSLYFNSDAVTDQLPIILLGDGQGGFTVDTNRLPIDMQHKAIYSFELINVDGNGNPDLFIGGTPEQYEKEVASNADYRFGYPNGYIKNDGIGNFKTELKKFPAVTENGVVFAGALDFNFANGQIYYHHDNVDYVNLVIKFEKVDLKTLQSTTIYTHNGYYDNHKMWNSFMAVDLIKNILVPKSIGCSGVDNDASSSVCGYSVGL